MTLLYPQSQTLKHSASIPNTQLHIGPHHLLPRPVLLKLELHQRPLEGLVAQVLGPPLEGLISRSEVMSECAFLTCPQGMLCSCCQEHPFQSCTPRPRAF